MLHHRKFCSILLGYLAPEDGGAGGGGGGGAAAPAAAGTGTSSTATPAAATPPAGGTGSAAPAAGGAAAAAPAAGSLVGDATITPPAFDAAAAKAFLTEKGVKAEELATLDEAKLKEKYDAAKAAAEKTADTKVEDIKIAVPEGVQVNEKLLGDFKGVLADASLDPSARAQKLFDMHTAELKAQAEQPHTYWANLQKEWQAAVAKDPEIGDGNLAFRNKVFATALDAYGKQYGPEAQTELKQMLGMTGAGNNLHMARFIYSAWKDRVEGGPNVGKPAGSEDANKRTLAAMYPTANVN